MLSKALALIVALPAGIVLFGGVETSRAQESTTSATPLIDKLNYQAANIKRAHANRCLGNPVFRWHPGYKVPAHMREFVIEQRGKRLARVRSLRSQCMMAVATAWHQGSAARCVRSKEGGLNSINPAGPYYGWYQTDSSFQRAYGREFYNQWGPGLWPAYAQIITAYRGWRARYWYPWPNTARACGLI